MDWEAAVQERSPWSKINTFKLDQRLRARTHTRTEARKKLSGGRFYDEIRQDWVGWPTIKHGRIMLWVCLFFFIYSGTFFHVTNSCSWSTGPLLQSDGHAFLLWESSAIHLRRLGHFYRSPHTQRTSGQPEMTDPMPWERALRETERWEKRQQGFFRYDSDVLHHRNCPSDQNVSLTIQSEEWMNEWMS